MHISSLNQFARLLAHFNAKQNTSVNYVLINFITQSGAIWQNSTNCSCKSNKTAC